MIDDNSKEFIKRHIGPSEEDQSKMLQYVGYKSLEINQCQKTML
jgi:glycine cleavage system pyridoxal-binding protein P